MTIGFFIGQIIAWQILLGCLILIIFDIYHFLDIVNWIV